MASSPSLLEEPSTPPPAFYCPISLELMTDPVTLSSGITYDRISIQRWLSAGHLTCPVTRQPLLPHPSFIPNHTLLRIIRAWCDAHSLRDNSVALLHCRNSVALSDGHVRLGHKCREALLKLGLLIHSDDGKIGAAVAERIPQQQAAPLLISVIIHYSADACRQDELAEHVCAEAISALAPLPLSYRNLAPFAHPDMLHYLAYVLQNSHGHSRISSACLLAKLISQHPSPTPFLRSLSPQFLSVLTGGLALFLRNQSDPSTSLTQDVLQSLCFLCKASRTTLLSLAEAPLIALVHAAMEQLLISARQGASPTSEIALSLLEVLSTCAEGRAAIASHAFAVPTLARFLQRSSSEVAMEAAVVVLWKLCRYCCEDKVRQQAMAACVPSKLVLLMQSGHCSRRAKSKAGCLVRLLIGEAKSKLSPIDA